MVHPHVVKVSEEELAFLSDTSDASDLSDLSARLLDGYPNLKLVAVTRGAITALPTRSEVEALPAG